MNKILYFHTQVKKFQNYIYFIYNCVTSVNRDDMYSIGLHASFQEFMHVYTVPMHS
jgi:hypothetical protein